MRWKQHPLRVLRESSGLNQHEVAKRAGVSQAKLSLVENHLATLTEDETHKIRTAILEVSRDSYAAVLRSADPRLAAAIEEIESSASKKKLFDRLQEGRGFSELEAAIAVLGRGYPAR
ncbi:MAG: hypothetical protein JWN74_2292 [Acidobacteriaceae bacterium]|nr:hypothetical protein [Acidobacteriaceae bacterium]